jgi:chromosome partitioning protein
MAIYAFCGTKGGIGKTTLAVQFACAKARDGQRVLVLDADPQGSASASITLRADRPDLPQIAAGRVSDGRALRAQALHQATLFDIVVIDAGAGDSSALRAALIVADVVTVPYGPREYDVWALGEAAELIAEARAQRDGLAALAILNRGDPGVLNRRNAAASDAAAEVAEFVALDVAIGSRVAIADASAAGLAVAELPDPDPKASTEIARFVAAVTAAVEAKKST